MLIKIPNVNVIKEALFSIDANKTPGPNGFGVGLFPTLLGAYQIWFLSMYH